MRSKQLQAAWLPQDLGSWQATPPPAFLSGLWFHFPHLSWCLCPFSPCRLALSGLLVWLRARDLPGALPLVLGCQRNRSPGLGAGVRLSTPLGEAGHMVSGTGWQAVLGTAATMWVAFLMRGMFWGRQANGVSPSLRALGMMGEVDP